jgi:hypothetical protein
VNRVAGKHDMRLGWGVGRRVMGGVNRAAGKHDMRLGWGIGRRVMGGVNRTAGAHGVASEAVGGLVLWRNMASWRVIGCEDRQWNEKGSLHGASFYGVWV